MKKVQYCHENTLKEKVSNFKSKERECNKYKNELKKLAQQKERFRHLLHNRGVNEEPVSCFVVCCLLEFYCESLG